MARTIRSHPTSPFVLPEPIFRTSFIYSKHDPKMDVPFLYFSKLGRLLHPMAVVETVLLVLYRATAVQQQH